MRCFTYVQLGHYSSKCLEKVGKQKGIQLAQTQPDYEPPKAVEECVNPPKQGETMLLKQVLDADELVQRIIFLRMTCKAKGKYCKLIIDNGSIDNLVSTEMVEKLQLEKMPQYAK